MLPCLSHLRGALVRIVNKSATVGAGGRCPAASGAELPAARVQRRSALAGWCQIMVGVNNSGF